jgi:signal peptidase II
MSTQPKVFGQPLWGALSGFGAVVAIAAFAADRLHKWWSLQVLDMPGRGRIEITQNFDIVMAWNKGVSYGLFQAETTAGLVGLVLFALAIVIGLGLWLAKADNRPLAVAIGLIIGGALGNVLDRLIYGAVADFFSFHAFGFYWYIFNVADVWIAIGVGLILIESFFPKVFAVPSATQSGAAGGAAAGGGADAGFGGGRHSSAGHHGDSHDGGHGDGGGGDGGGD